MKIYSDPRLLSLGIVHGTVSRQAGNMRERANQDALFKQLNIPTDKILRLHQVHSADLVTILNEQAALAQQAQNPLTQADGWIISPQGWGASVLTADCVPLFLWDETAHLTALVHAGWRGVAQGLHPKPPAKCANWEPKVKFAPTWGRIYKNAVLKYRKTPPASLTRGASSAKTAKYLWT